MDRYLQGTPATLQFTMLAGTAATDPLPDSATVEIIASDGTTVLPPGSSTTNSGTGTFTRSLTPSQTAQLDILTCRWTMTIGTSTTFKTYVEIVGGFLISLPDLGAVFPDRDDAALARIRTGTEQRFERQCGRAFVPRYAFETKTSRNRPRLTWPEVRLFRYARVGTTVLSPTDVAGLWISPGGIVYRLPARTGVGLQNITLGYEHGLDYPSEDIREAMVLAAQETFPVDPQDSRVVRREADNQAISFVSPSTSGTGGGFVNPLLRALVRDNRRPLVA